MRILYVLNSGDPGGMEQHVVDLINGAKQNGHEIHVWCGLGEATKWFEDTDAVVTVRKIRFDIDPTYIFSLYQYLKNNQIDVVHAHELKAVVNSLLAAKIAKTPVKITHTHTPISEWQIPQFKKTLNAKFYSFFINNLATKEIALTETRKNVKVVEGIKSEKLEIIPNGLDTVQFEISGEVQTSARDEIRARYNISPQTFVFGNISRLTIEKGHEVLIRAFHKFIQHKDVENVHLLIGGGGAMHEYYNNLIKDLDLDSKISITGRFADEDKLKLYSSFDAFVFPSVAEGFGIVLMEAMCMNLPIICSNLEVLEEVAGSTVFSYFETNDYESLADKMFALYTKRDRLDELTADAQNRVQELFSMQSFYDRYEELYESTISGTN